MDFWTHLFDSEYKQRADIESLRRASNARRRQQMLARRATQDHQGRIAQLEDQVGELALLCRSLLTILREDGTVQPERFEQVMKQIDAEDGVEDGMITPERPPEDDPTAAPKITPWPKNVRIQ